MDEGLRTRARRVEREPEASQAAKRRPRGSALTVPHRQVLGEAREEHIPALILDSVRHISQQLLTLPGWLLVVLATGAAADAGQQ